MDLLFRGIRDGGKSSLICNCMNNSMLLLRLIIYSHFQQITFILLFRVTNIIRINGLIGIKLLTLH